MKTYTKLLTDYQTLTKNTSAANQTLGAQLLNDSIRTVCNLQGGKLRFLETTTDIYTVADQEGYEIPNKYRKLIDTYIYSDAASDPAGKSTLYSPEMVFDPTKWKLIKQYRLGTGTVPYFTYVENRRLLIQPIPSATGNKITLRGRLNTSDLTRADYTTGSIVSVANGGTAVVGFGTSWNASMIGSYIQIAETTAANGGDGFWYEISAVPSATSLTLVKPYDGTAISAATNAYTIGQCSVIPEAYDIAPVLRAAAMYWAINNPAQPNTALSNYYWKQYDGGNEAGLSDSYGGLIGQMLANEGETEEGAYLPPFGRSSNLPNAPYYFPYQDASGF